MTGTPIGDEVAEFMRHLMHHGHHGAPAQDPGAATQTPAAAPVNLAANVAIPATARENPVSLFTEVKQDFATVAAKIAAIDEEAIRLAEQIGTIPGAKELVGALIATLGVSPQLVSTFTALATDIGQAVPQPAPAAPAEPQPA
jgi:hypothetical protein